MNETDYNTASAVALTPDYCVHFTEERSASNRYTYCLNNPLIYNDPSGNIIAFTDWGYEFWKSISPIAIKLSLHFGSDKGGIGADISLGMPTMLPIAYRWHWGASYYTKYYGIDENGQTSYSGWETRKGSEVSLLYGSVSLSTTHFNLEGEKFDQTTSRLHIGVGPSIGFRYENDFFTNDPKVVKNEFLVRTGLWISETFNVEIANSGTDEHRTARAQFGIYGVLDGGVILFTGDPGPKIIDRYTYEIDGQAYYGAYDNYNPDEYRAGIFYIGIGGVRIGKNSESIRHQWQNVRAHKKNGIPYFKIMEWAFLPRFYWGFGSTGNTGW